MAESVESWDMGRVVKYKIFAKEGEAVSTDFPGELFQFLQFFFFLCSLIFLQEKKGTQSPLISRLFSHFLPLFERVIPPISNNSQVAYCPYHGKLSTTVTNWIPSYFYQSILCGYCLTHVPCHKTRNDSQKRVCLALCCL